MNQTVDVKSAAGTTAFCILGTAGHIDHGKSALVKSLTGTDPDRLPEEKARGMTIELGFAHMTVPGVAGGSDIKVGLVDVPGHERFIKTMVAGASGVDMAMLVVAADDGVMPQTREHVEILHLLGIDVGFIVISKADLAIDERIEVIREQIAELIAGTRLDAWPIVVASARSGRGLDEIREMIAIQARNLPQEHSEVMFRLAIDRVFPIQGRGTVVTGSVLAGTIAPDAALELLPIQTLCRVREIQSYGSASPRVGPGQRAALNLTGVDRDKVKRGMELATPAWLTPSRYVDARFEMLARRIKPLASHQHVRVSMGTNEHMAIMVIVGAAQVSPGGQALVQLRFSEPVVSAFGQRFIVRSENAEATLGGGDVIRPAAKRLHANNADTLSSLQRAASPEAVQRIEEAIRTSEFAIPAMSRLSAMSGVRSSAIEQIMEQFRRTGVLLSLIPGVEAHRDTVAGLERRSLAYLQRHHQLNPLEPGILRDRFIGWLDRRGINGLGKIVCSRLEKAGIFVSRGPYIAHRDFRPALKPEDSLLLETIVAEIVTADLDPPVWSALRSLAGTSAQRSRVMEDLARGDARLTLFAPGQYISRASVNKFSLVVSKIGAGRRFKLAEVRDALQLSRRVVQPLLEYLDRVGETRRIGDERILLDKAR
jgi:selenocysteine-specific elongation factor